MRRRAPSAGIYEPARGRVRVEGRITSLLSINVGIEEEATGLENIILRGLAAGMTKREIERHTADIVDFLIGRIVCDDDHSEIAT